MTENLNRIETCFSLGKRVNGVEWHRLPYLAIAEVIIAAAIAYFAYIQTYLGERQLDAMQGQLDAMKEQNDVMIEQTELAKGQLEQAKAATRQTESMIDQVKVEQRAWLSMIALIDRPFFDTLTIKIVIRNSGKTPGKIKHIAMTNYTATAPLNSDPILRQHLETGEPKPVSGVVSPETTTTVPFVGVPVPEAVLVKPGQVSLAMFVVFATLTYEDVTGQERTTQGCWIYQQGDPDNLVQYHKHNYMQ